MMRFWVTILVAVILGSCPEVFAAGKTRILASGRICDEAETVCLQGKITQDADGEVIVVAARMARAPGAGVVELLLGGTDSQGNRCGTSFEITIRGRRSEIIRREYRPGKPGRITWNLVLIRFNPASQ